MWKPGSSSSSAANPVGTLPFVSPPRCGLYRAELTGDPPSGASSALRRLHKAVATDLDDRRKAEDQNPHDRLGVCSCIEPFSDPADAGVSIVATNTTVSTTVRFTYNVDNDFVMAAGKDHRKTVAFFFPFSECGPQIQSFNATMNGLPLFGQVVRARRSDGRLIPSSEHLKRAFLGECSDLSDDDDDGGDDDDAAASVAPAEIKEAAKLLYYYVVPDVLLTMFLLEKPADKNADPAGATKNGPAAPALNRTSFQIEVAWRCKNAPGEDSKLLNVIYSLYCTPRYPDHMSLNVQLKPDQKIRIVRSPNCRGGLTLRSDVRGHAAQAHTEAVLGGPLSQYRLPSDYLFVFLVYLGDVPQVVEEVSRWGATAIIIVVAYFTWFFLTKDLTL